MLFFVEAKPDIEIKHEFKDENCTISCKATDMPANSEVYDFDYDKILFKFVPDFAFL